MTVSDNTMQAEGLSNFFKKSGKISAKAEKKLATKVIKIMLEFLKLVLTLLPQRQVEVLKQHYQHCRR